MSGKKFADATKKYDGDQLFTPTEALALVKSLASAKFDETVEIAVRLGVGCDLKHLNGTGRNP